MKIKQAIVRFLSWLILKISKDPVNPYLEKGYAKRLDEMAKEQNIKPVKTPAWADLRVPYEELNADEHVKRNEMLGGAGQKKIEKAEVQQASGITESQKNILEQAQYELQLAEVREKTVESEMKAAEMVLRKRSVEGQDAQQIKDIADEKDTSAFPEEQIDPVKPPLGITSDGKMKFE